MTVLADLGWFSWLFAIVVAGPSVLSILQSVFVDHRLIAALQWIVDGYNTILAVLGGIFEPLVQPVVDWVNRWLGWNLHIQPYWRPLMVLCAMATVGHARALWAAGRRSFAVWFGVSATASALLGSLVAGLIPPDGLASTFVGVAPVTILALILTILLSWETLYVGDFESLIEAIARILAAPLVVGIAIFTLGVLVIAVNPTLNPVPVAIVSLALLILSFAILLLSTALQERRNDDARSALTILGGFVVAGLILIADQVVKAFPAAGP